MKVMAIVAHPDDEVIGVGGTLIRHIMNNDTVFVLYASEGRSSRADSYEEFDMKTLDLYDKEMQNALYTMGVHESKRLNFPNNRMDHVDLLTIIKEFQRAIDDFMPDILYTHFDNDLNIDHSITCKAAITAARALPGSCAQQILFFETFSSTEQAMAVRSTFCPNLFVNVTDQIELKMQAMSCYKSELREPPHPRSLKLIRMNASVWGAKCGLAYAEAFMVSRIIRY